MPASPPPRWHDAAAAATFVPYELIRPAPLIRRPGGFGYTDFTTVCNLDLAFEVPGGEIEVSTRLRDERLAASFRQFLMPQVLAALHPFELALPVTVRIEESDRDVLVGDTPCGSRASPWSSGASGPDGRCCRPASFKSTYDEATQGISPSRCATTWPRLLIPTESADRQIGGSGLGGRRGRASARPLGLCPERVPGELGRGRVLGPAVPGCVAHLREPAGRPLGPGERGAAGKRCRSIGRAALPSDEYNPAGEGESREWE